MFCIHFIAFLKLFIIDKFREIFLNSRDIRDIYFKNEYFWKKCCINVSLNISGNWYFYCITITSGKMFPDKQSPVIYIRCNFCKMQETWYLRCFDLDEGTWCWLDKSMQLMKVLHYTTGLANLAVLFASWVIDWKTIAFIYSSIDGYRILGNKITINQNWLAIQLFITFCYPLL